MQPQELIQTSYPTGRNVFLAKNGVQVSVCILRNSRLHCFDSNNYPIEKDHIKQVFNDLTCTESVDAQNGNTVTCTGSDFKCYVSAIGDAYCRDYTLNQMCLSTYLGTSNCCQISGN